MFCSNCGTEAIEGAVFCQKCGAKLVQENNGVQEPVSATGSALKPRQNPVIGEELAHGSKPISVSVPEPIETPADRTNSIQDNNIFEEASEGLKTVKQCYIWMILLWIAGIIFAIVCIIEICDILSGEIYDAAIVGIIAMLGGIIGATTGTVVISLKIINRLKYIKSNKSN